MFPLGETLESSEDPLRFWVGVPFLICANPPRGIYGAVRGRETPSPLSFPQVRTSARGGGRGKPTFSTPVVGRAAPRPCHCRAVLLAVQTDGCPSSPGRGATLRHVQRGHALFA